jgi:hypothetical protein
MHIIVKLVPAKLRCVLAVLIAAILAGMSALAQGTAVNAQYTETPVPLDGQLGSVWSQATAYPISNIYPASGYTGAPGACNSVSTLRALWDGSRLYVMVSVADPTVNGGSAFAGDVAEFWIDHFNDKVQKFEEDDGTFVISAPGATGTVGTSANGTNAGDNIYPNLADRYLAGYKSTLQTNASGAPTGYNVEFAWYVGDHVSAIGNHASLNGSQIGFDATVYVADTAGSTTRTCRQLLSPATADRTTNNNQPWGTITLMGYNTMTSSPMQLDTFLLKSNLGAGYQATFGNVLPPVTNKATWAAANSAIWNSTTQLNADIANAQTALTGTSQSAIDAAALALDADLRALKRTGPYPYGNSGSFPDPYDLPTINSLNDPFLFLDGSRVKSLADWTRRQAEIKNLAQYYEFGWVPPAPPTLIATSSGTATTKTIALNMAASNGNTYSTTNAVKITLPSGASVNGKTAPWPLIVSIDLSATPGTAPAAYLAAGYAVADIGYTAWANDGPTPSGALNTLYPFNLNTGQDYGSLMGWAWGASRALDAVQYLIANDPTYTVVNGNNQTVPLIDMSKASVIGFSRAGKATLAAGFFDPRFKVTAAGGSGNGGAAPYRYAADNNYPAGPKNNPGHMYWWSGGVGNGGEAMGDHIRHNTWNTNEMSRSFLADQDPRTFQPRMYRQPVGSWGYGTRLPYDHHLEIAAIAPRAVLLDESSDDYADEAEGDAVGWEGALPVYKYLGVQQNLAIDTYMEVNNPAYHSLKTPQASNFISFLDYQLYGIPLPTTVPAGDNTFVLPVNSVPTNQKLYTDFFLTGDVNHNSIYNTYYGGFSSMMPWLNLVPHANLLTKLTLSAGALSPVFVMTGNNYTATVAYGVSSLTVSASSEDPKATIAINGQTPAAGTATQTIALSPGVTTVPVTVTAVDGATNVYQIAITETGAPTSTTVASSNLSANVGASVTFTATVSAATGATAPTGIVNFLDGTAVIGSGMLTSSGAATSTATYATSSLTAGTHSITAVYLASLTLMTSTSTAVSQVVVASAISGAISSSTLSIAQGSTGTATLTLTPVGGYTGTATLACGMLPVNVSCSFSPASLSFTGTNAPQTSTLTIGTQAMSAATVPGFRQPPTASGIAWAFFGIPFVGLLSIPGLRRKLAHQSLFGLLALALFSLGAAAALSGCSGSGSKTAVDGTYVIPLTITANGATTNVSSITVVIH